MARHVLDTRELDLSVRKRDLLGARTASAVQDSLNALPGFRTSAAFFTFLRANLVIPPTHSAMSSNTSTPVLGAASSQNLPPPSPSPLPISETLNPTPDPDPLAGVPPLMTYVLTSSIDRLAGLKLVADSIAQQRQSASRAIIFHHLSFAVWIALAAIFFKMLYKVPGDIGIVITTMGGCTMTMLVAIRALTGGYLNEAEKLKWDFLKNPDTGTDDLFIGTKFGDEIMAALVLRLEPSPDSSGSNSSKKRGSRLNNSGKGGKGLIRAWTVRLRFRHNGVGTGLLEEAVKITRGKLGRDAEIGFAADHANSVMILPGIFNGPFRKREAMAIRMLEEVINGMDDKKRR